MVLMATDAEAGATLMPTGVPPLTVTRVDAATKPPALVAVRTNVVLALGVRVTELPVTTPGRGAMLTESAPVKDQ